MKTTAMRVGGYAAIRDYAAIGDGRTLALVGVDGSIDWLCLPNLDSGSVCAALLDAERGGSFQLAPEVPFTTERRYVPDTNVLESTFVTDAGVVRVTDAMLLPSQGLTPGRELARRVEGVAGCVPLAWRVDPRFEYGAGRTRLGWRGGVPVATSGRDALAVCAWGAGDSRLDEVSISGRVSLDEGTSALLVASAAHQEPLVFPSRGEVEARLDSTLHFWRHWAAMRTYEGPWREAVIRSALALKLLRYSPSGAIAAAGTTSLPEEVGGERNWDYRFCWIRDSAFTLNALMRLGCPAEAESFFWWLLHASQLTQPRLQVLYRLDGGGEALERELDLNGYRSSRPVRVGNGAAHQQQLDIYGDLLQTAFLYAEAGGRIDRETGRRLAGMADHISAVWREPDCGIWEVRGEALHFTHSKMMCWVALDRAVSLAEAGWLPRGRLARWREEAHAVHDFIERRCWSDELSSYVRSADSTELDASLLLGALMAFPSGRDPQMTLTIDAVRKDLGDGALLDRYRGGDGLRGEEGAFLCCSFWLVDALARAGRLDEASEAMQELIGLANDVGLYAEEVDRESGEFLGNFPQGLVHLALINAAISMTRARRG
jgi:GH15 family glucan-1,4-alpha-glucosidase